MKRWSHLLFVLVPMLNACALQPAETHQAVRYYDFGTPLTAAATCRLNMRLGKITLSSALQGNRIWYRHDSDPFEPRAYAISRWTASPAELIRRHLHATFEGVESDAYVEVQVVRMELNIDIENRAATVLTLSATVFTKNLGGKIETRPFSIVQPSQASPAGAAAAFSSSTSAWRETLCQWQERVHAL